MRNVYLKTTGEGPQNLCRVFLMLSLRVDSSKYQVLWSDAEGPAVGSRHTYTHRHVHTHTPKCKDANTDTQTDTQEHHTVII